MSTTIANPFNTSMTPQGTTLNAQAIAEQQRAMSEVYTSFMIAKQFPRDQIKNMDKILQACTRMGLAEVALYSYAKGGTEITGPTIRIAEALAQGWGNIHYGWKELSQQNGRSTIYAFATDLESNNISDLTFDVPHTRYTKKGTYKLEDPREIYEHLANQAARRLRKCILSVMPGDVIESALNQCELTLVSKADLSPENIKKMVSLFEQYSITLEMLEKKIQRRMDSINAAQMISLRKIYNSLKDGLATPSSFFDMSIAVSNPSQAPANQSTADIAKEKLKKGKPVASPLIIEPHIDPAYKVMPPKDGVMTNEHEKPTSVVFKHAGVPGYSESLEKSWDNFSKDEPTEK